MGPDFIQHAIVTLAAMGAVWFVARRVFAFVKPAAGSAAPKCASCPAAAPAAQAHKPAQAVSSETKPLTLIR
jgi:hypothetical protein